MIRKAAVIGAGTMGSGIAAQFANAGASVVLLDIVPAGAGNRNALAEGGIARQLKVQGFMHPDCAARVEAGNVEDHLDRLADADWIVEAIVEDATAKRDLYRRIESVRKDEAMVSSNTSTIPRSVLKADLGSRFAGHFAISHFFNPPRHMRLLEIITGEDTKPEIAQRMREAGEVVLGKTAIDCRDTPGFIANRLGCYWMSVATLEALASGLAPEEADAVAGPPFGFPPTGIFGLLDLIGIDLIPNVWTSLYQALPAEDPFQSYDLPGNTVIRDMIAAGRVGHKAGAGFYRQHGTGPGKTLEVYDHEANCYRPLKTLPRAGDLVALCGQRDRAGRYAWRMFSRLLSYAAQVAPEIAGDVATIDTAMRLGYAWSEGPFTLADRYGVGSIVDRLAAEGEAVPDLMRKAAVQGGFYADHGHRYFRTDGTMQTRAVRADTQTVAEAIAGRARVSGNASANLWDIGEAIACLQITTKGNVIDRHVLDMVAHAAQVVPGRFRALVIASDGPFSAGTDLAAFLDLINGVRWSELDAFLRHGQNAFGALRQSAVPVVAAASGMALGGGLQLMLHCDAIVAHAELAAGLNEITAGLIPAWGGCVRLLARRLADANSGHGPAAAASSVFDVLANGKSSRSALYAREYGYLAASDSVVMNADRVFSAARERAKSFAESGYTPPTAIPLYLAGPSGKAALMNFVRANAVAGRATAHDVAVCDKLAGVLTGGATDHLVPLSEDDVLRLERENCIALAQSPETLARLRHLRETGKPLRN